MKIWLIFWDKIKKGIFKYILIYVLVKLINLCHCQALKPFWNHQRQSQKFRQLTVPSFLAQKQGYGHTTVTAPVRRCAKALKFHLEPHKTKKLHKNSAKWSKNFTKAQSQHIKMLAIIPAQLSSLFLNGEN